MRVIVIAYLVLLVVWPVVWVVRTTFAHGLTALTDAFADPSVLAALRLTLVVSATAVVVNTVFGVGISLLLVRSRFPGKRALSALIDVPLAISPVVVGLSLLLVYGGRGGWLGTNLVGDRFRVVF